MIKGKFAIVLIQFFVIWSLSVLSAQDTIRLVNGSFEGGMIGPNIIPPGWSATAFDQYPDIQPGINGVDLPAHDGKKYISLTAHNERLEAVFQHFNGNQILHKDSTYHMFLYLATDSKYRNIELQWARFDDPVYLVLMGLNRDQSKAEVLASTPMVTNKNWSRYHLYFRPSLDSLNEIGLYAFPSKVQEKFVGNLLIDKVSMIYPIRKPFADTLVLEPGFAIELKKPNADSI
jgi:hypothetical protein